jgi:hypothetical protein
LPTKNIKTFKIGAGKEKWSFESHFCEWNPWWSSLIETPDNKNFEKETIIVEKLDDLLKWEKIDFIKMDIEWFEWEAIQGMSEILKSTKYMIFEYSPKMFSTPYNYDLLDYLKKIWFKLSHIENNWDLKEIIDTKDYWENIKVQTDVFCEK